MLVGASLSLNDKGPLAFNSSSFAGYARSDRPLRGSRTDYASGGNHCCYLVLPYLVGRGALIGPGVLMGRGALRLDGQKDARAMTPNLFDVIK